MTTATYIDTVNRRYKTGISREHTYRGDLQTLLMTLLPDVLVTNEPSRVDCGAPDYVLTKKDVPVGYIEAKDIGVDLKSKTLKEQFDRYRSGLSNLIFTDYLEFHFYKDGIFTTSIAIAKIENGSIASITENFATFEALIKNFALTVSQTIKSPTKLAEMMAGKAKLMADVIEKSLKHDDETETKSALKSQMLSFKQMLIHDITNSAFADIYAQTIAYGMFAARYHDPTLPTFSREEAATLIPKSNPFLRRLFQEIAGYDLDDRLIWIVDELVNIFLATNVANIMKNFGKSTKQEDPVVHFYETFLATYNPALRKARGVWYTPQPVVNFIVRAVDDVLKNEFNLHEGLADTSKIKIKKSVLKFDERSKDKSIIIGEKIVEQEVHRVQILDPATGTGTFLAEVVKHIYKKFEGQQGMWSIYVNQHLIPRLNGFELLMASYAMAHLKMDMLLTETGYKATTDQRFRIFLTNSLEEAHRDARTLFSSLLSDEADHANAIKREAPVMVVMGNPPYSGVSSNNGEWISSLIDDYKYIDGEYFNERKHWLNDDYVKFIRFGEHFINKNGEGVLAFINPHGFLDNPTFRGMRWHLLTTFDKIYTIDLHGNNKKKEVAPDGTPDVNVFDIMQGVSINLFVKKRSSENQRLADVFHYDLYGKRDYKYDFLSKNNLRSIEFKTLKVEKPYFFFVPKNESATEEFEKGFRVDELFNLNKIGICTQRDSIAVQFDESKLRNVLSDLVTFDVENFRNKYKERPDGRDWKIETAKSNVIDTKSNSQYVRKINYRIFDKRYTYYTNKSKGFMAYPRYDTLKHLLKGNNYALVLPRQLATKEYKHVFITDEIFDQCFISNLTKEGNYAFPLYLYSDPTTQITIEKQIERLPNLNNVIIQQIATELGIVFTNEKEEVGFAPIDLLDYIYAVLHSPTYREKYKEFLKIDFPRVPYPTDAKQFFELVALGKQLRELHLLESPGTEKYITQYPIDGNNEVVKPAYKEGKVFINDEQYFDNVPEAAWNFYIGGYQPAQKWLKDRKSRILQFEDILHYQKIIVALNETERLMGEIDKIGFEQ
jgi:predicted helicase